MDGVGAINYEPPTNTENVEQVEKAEVEMRTNMTY